MSNETTKTEQNSTSDLELLLPILKRLVQEPGEDSPAALVSRRAALRIRRELAALSVPPHNGSLQLLRAPRLHLGCGRRLLQDFVNIDLFPPAEVLYDLRVGVPCESNTASLIVVDHFLEHIDFDCSAPQFLKEVLRVLVPGGELLLSVPDVERAVLAYNTDTTYLAKIHEALFSGRVGGVRHDDGMNTISRLFHDAYADTRYSPHYWGYGFKSLVDLLTRSGFSRVVRLSEKSPFLTEKRHWWSLSVVAIK